MATASCPADPKLDDLNRDDESTEPAEKELNGAGVDDPKKDCWPNPNGADVLLKPSWAKFEPKSPDELPVELYELIGLAVEL